MLYQRDEWSARLALLERVYTAADALMRDKTPLVSELPLRAALDEVRRAEGGDDE